MDNLNMIKQNRSEVASQYKKSGAMKQVTQSVYQDTRKTIEPLKSPEKLDSSNISEEQSSQVELQVKDYHDASREFGAQNESQDLLMPFDPYKNHSDFTDSDKEFKSKEFKSKGSNKGKKEEITHENIQLVENKVNQNPKENIQFTNRESDKFKSGLISPALLRSVRNTNSSGEFTNYNDGKQNRIEIKSINIEDHHHHHHDGDSDNHNEKRDEVRYRDYQKYNTEMKQEIYVKINRSSNTQRSGIDLDHKLKGTRTAEQNMEIFMKKYRINVELPTLYKLSGLIYERKPEYCLQLLRYAISHSDQAHDSDDCHGHDKIDYCNIEQMVKTYSHNKEETPVSMSISDQYKGKHNNLLLMLLKKQGNQLVQIQKQVTFDQATNAIMKLSQCGNFLAVFLDFKDSCSQEIRICQIENSNLETMVKEMHDNVYYIKYKNQYNQRQKVDSDNLDLSFIKKLEFDKHSRYIIGYGTGTKLFILNLKTCEGQLHQIESLKIEQINCIRFNSKTQCIILCKVKGVKQIEIYQFTFRPNQKIYQNNLISKTNTDNFKKSGEMVINHISELTEDSIIMISRDGRTVLFANNNENFFIEIGEDNSKRKTRMNISQKQKIRFVIGDNDPKFANGFYYVCSEDYDKELILQHSHRKSIHLKIECNLQPHMFQIFDIYLAFDNSQQENLNKSRAQGLDHTTPFDKDTVSQPSQLVMISLRDDVFVYNMLHFKTEVQLPKAIDFNSTTMGNKFSNLKSGNQIVQTFQEEISQTSTLDSLSFNWPYIAFTGQDGHIMIFNAFQESWFHKVQIPGSRSLTVVKSYITQTNDLFFVVNDQSLYKIYHIDLDKCNMFEEGITEHNIYEELKEKQFHVGNPILKYKTDQVDNKRLTQIIARGDSHKDHINMDKNLQLFMLHQNMIYSWSMGSCQHHVKEVSQTSSDYLHQLNDSEFFFLFDNYQAGKMISQQIKKLSINYSGYNLETYYTQDLECDNCQKIATFNIDQIQFKCTILTSSTDKFGTNTQFYFKIFNLKTKKIDFQQPIENSELIGRMKSGLYTFADGHIYYGNNVIKIRYDLINSKESQQYKENNIFDYYYDIFQMRANQKINSLTPFDSFKGHRFCYFISDKEKKKPRIIFIVPYLHEKKIYLNRIKHSTKYFYTSISTSIEEVTEFRNQHSLKQFPTDRFRKKLDNDCNLTIKKEAKNLKKNIFGKLEKVHQCHTFKASKIFDSIVCMNQSENKYYIYSENGILVNRIEFSEQIEEFGNIVAFSNDGLSLVLKKSIVDINAERMHHHSDQGNFFHNFLTIHIFQLTTFGLKKVKSVNLFDSIQDYYKTDQNNEKMFQKLLNDNNWMKIEGKDFFSYSSNINIKIEVNDEQDICVKFSPNMNQEFMMKMMKLVNQSISESIEANCILFWEKHKASCNDTKEKIFKSCCNKKENIAVNQVQTRRLLEVSKSYEMEIDNEFMYYWNHNEINQVKLDQIKNGQHQTIVVKINYSVPKPIISVPKITSSEAKTTNCDHLSSSIFDVRTCSNSKMIAIIVKQNNDVYSDNVIIWDAIQNREFQSFQVMNPYEIIWDSQGNPFIVTVDKIYFTKQRCAINAYSYQNLNDLQDHILKKTFSQGHRFDAKNHNWLILQEYIALPFCYMTFVLKNKIEKNGQGLEGYVFDQESYNYIFNKSTAFLDSDFVQHDFIQLQWVLQNFEHINVDLLEQLNYFKDLQQENMGKIDDEYMQNQYGNLQTPLHLAFEEHNQQSIEVLLKYMSKIKLKSSINYLSIIENLLEYKNFKIYLNNLFFQTDQMQAKNMLIAQTRETSEIVKMVSANFISMNDMQISDKFDVNSQKGSFKFPVEVNTMQISWILNSKKGKIFLFTVWNMKDYDLYKIKSVKMLIEFLFQKFKRVIFGFTLPFQLLNIVSYLLFMYSVQTRKACLYRSDYLVQDEVVNTILGVKLVEDEQIKLLLEECTQIHDHNMSIKEHLIIYINQFFNISLLLINLQIFYQIKSRYFLRLYSWIDMIFLFLNLLIYAIIFNHSDNVIEQSNELEMLRYYIILATFVIFIKFSYFFQIVDAIAPLYDIMIQIAWDIRYFVLIQLLLCVQFAMAFKALADNQIDFDKISKGNKNEDNCDSEEQTIEKIPYKTLSGACWFVIDIMFALNSRVYFEYGEGTQFYWLLGMYSLVTFIMLVHMLNMLIAIMGDTFARRIEVSNEIMTHNHLKFVMDNFYLINFVFTNTNDVRYILSAFYAPEMEDSEDKTLLKDIASTKEDVAFVKEEILKLSKKVQKQ